MADEAGENMASETPMEDVTEEGTPADAGVQMEATDKENKEEDSTLCYCGKDRYLAGVELQCGICLRFYHSECVSCYLGNCIPFMTNYQFVCKLCSPNGLESFNKRQASFSQMCHTAVANLLAQSDTKNMFSKDKEIIPFIDKHWESLTSMPRRTKLTWHTTVAKTMLKETDVFRCDDDDQYDPHFGLVNEDLTAIGPNYDTLKSSGAQKSMEGKLASSLSDSKTRGAKRKTLGDSQTLPGVKQKKGDLNASTRLAPHGYPLEHPFNKDGYRYILAESDPHAPGRQAFDESLDWAGKPIPGELYRKFLGSQVTLALHDRAPQLKISDDRLTVTGEKGYSMIRATHSVNKGSWYYEVTIEEMPPEASTRIGWSQALGNLQAPCGYDKFSYSWRSLKGTKFHQSRGKHYANKGYKEGDVLGLYISLPWPTDHSKLLPQTPKDKPLIKFKSHLYYEEKDNVTETENNLKPAENSKIVMYKNGKAQGVAWENIFAGSYYPAISLYKNATVAINFGPDFRYPPKDLKDYQPISAAAIDSVVEHTLGDILFHIDNEGKSVIDIGLI